MDNINKPLKSIAIYCGSNMGSNEMHAKIAADLTAVLVNAGIDIIYGGGKLGLMGVVADTALNAGGKVIGVIPQALVNYEVAHAGLTELHIVNSMHERKALMAELADGFIMLPGGPGTWEEFFEVITWGKLGYHNKPCGILNAEHYYDHLIQFLLHAVAESFVHPKHYEMILVDTSPPALIAQFMHYQAPKISAWINQEVIELITDG